MSLLFNPHHRNPLLELLFVIFISCLIALVFCGVLGRFAVSL